MNLQPWFYFLSLERDFVRTINFVELHPDNAGSFSNEYAKLLLLIGSEVDVVAKMLCADVAPGGTAKNIVDYQSTISRAFRGMHSAKIDVSRYGLEIQPWLSWDPAVAASPDWWKAYNAVKHQRVTNFRAACQQNVFYSLCGLLVLLLYFYRKYPDLQLSF